MWSPEIQYEHFTNDFTNDILSVFSEGVVNIEIDCIHSTVIAIIQQSLEYQKRLQVSWGKKAHHVFDHISWEWSLMLSACCFHDQDSRGRSGPEGGGTAHDFPQQK